MHMRILRICVCHMPIIEFRFLTFSAPFLSGCPQYNTAFGTCKIGKFDSWL